MILTKKNIEKWKASLDKKMMSKYEEPEYSKTQKDQDWINDCLGMSDDEVIDNEVSYWEE